jgi:hypothetical protein
MAHSHSSGRKIGKTRSSGLDSSSCEKEWLPKKNIRNKKHRTNNIEVPILKFWNKIPLKSRIIFVVFSFLALVGLADHILFNKYFYQIPNELEWDTSPWYNFKHKTMNLKPYGYFEDGVLVVGSSVAMYSALPEDIQNLMNQKRESKRTYKVDFYAHVAMSPTDLYYYLDDLISKNPKQVAYLLNTGDFQMDYFNLTPELKLNGYNDEIRALDYSGRFPVKLFYPAQFVRDYYSYLHKFQIFSLLAKSILHVNRVRLFFRDPLDAYYERHNRKGRSYHNYTGTTPNEGIYIKGWTLPTFTIHCELTDGALDELIYIAIPETEVKVFDDSKEVFAKTFPEVGWHKIRIEFERSNSYKLLLITSNKTISSREIDPKSYAKERNYGIRLSQNFCKREFEENISYRRPQALEDKNLAEMSIEEYTQDYIHRMYEDADKRPEIRRHVLLRNIKKALSKEEKFVPWKEFEYLDKIKERLTKEGISFLIINNPENPIELEIYRNSVWYQGYIEYLQSKDDQVNTFFYDLSQYLTDPRDFLDSHHLSYLGSFKMSPIYSEIFSRHVSK